MFSEFTCNAELMGQFDISFRHFNKILDAEIADFFVASLSGCSAVRLAHWFWEPGVGGSNPLAPTNFC